MSRNKAVAIGLAVALLGAVAAERTQAGTITGRREEQFGGGIHESWVWFTGVGANATDAWALQLTWGGDFTINNVKAGQYWVAASDYGAYPHNIGPKITVPSSGTVDVQLRDRNMMDSYGTTDLGSATWSAQTFVATGTDIRLVTTISPSSNVWLRITIRQDEPDGPQVGPERTVRVDALSTVGFARWDYREVATIAGRRYAVRQDVISSQSWRPALSYRTNQYPNGHAWLDGQAIPEADLAVTVTGSDDGFILDYDAGGSWRPNSFSELVQTFVPRGEELRIARMMLAGQVGFVMRASVHQWSGSYPPGAQVGVAKHAQMSSNLCQGFVWGPGEAPLTPGATYAIRFVRADSQTFAIYGDSDTYSQGKAYFDGVPSGGIDMVGTLVTKEVNRGDIVFSNVSFTPISATEVRATFNTDVATTATVAYRTGTPVFRTVVPADATPKTSHDIIVRHLQPGTTYKMDFVAHNSARNVRRPADATEVTVVTPNQSALFTGHVQSQAGAVAGAKVILEEVQVSTFTNASGDFTFASAPTGRHTLRVEGVACQAVTQEVDVTADGLATADVVTIVYTNLLAGTDNNPIQGWTLYGNLDGQWNSGDWSVYARTGPKWIGSVGHYSPKSGGMYRTVSTEPGQSYVYSGYVLTDAYGSSSDPIEGLAVARLGVDPYGGTDPASPFVVWGRYRFTKHAWKEIPLAFNAMAAQATLFAEHKWESFYQLPPWFIAGFDDLWVGRQRLPIPDFDVDGDVDQEDFGHFQFCLAGSGVTPGADCTNADLDVDLDVDQQDFARFQKCLSGPDVPLNPSCTD